LKKLREHSQRPCSGPARCHEALLPICTWKTGDRELDPAARFLTPPGGLFIKAIWCSFLRLAALPDHPGRHCSLGDCSRQTYFGTRT
jgi:hypothetical protein